MSLLLPTAAAQNAAATPAGATQANLFAGSGNSGGPVLDNATQPGRNNSVTALDITIIESQSTNTAHDMDLQWQSVAAGMGHSATIVGQATLSSDAFMNTTDILIVSSGIIALSSTAVANIEEFMRRGGGVYISGEYLVTYTTNIAFETIVTNMGGSFSWTGTTSGDLAPMAVVGSLQGTPNAVPPLPYYWYGTFASATATCEAFLSSAGLNYGFVFSPPNKCQGELIQTSDQDWARNPSGFIEPRLLMENIITRLTPDLKLRILGPCPGPVTVSVCGASPGGPVAFVTDTGLGSFTIPGGVVCAGTQLCLSGTNIKLRRTLAADGGGNITFGATVPAAACGVIYVEAVDLRRCTASNVIKL